MVRSALRHLFRGTKPWTLETLWEVIDRPDLWLERLGLPKDPRYSVIMPLFKEFCLWRYQKVHDGEGPGLREEEPLPPGEGMEEGPGLHEDLSLPPGEGMEEEPLPPGEGPGAHEETASRGVR